MILMFKLICFATEPHLDLTIPLKKPHSFEMPISYKNQRLDSSFLPLKMALRESANKRV